MVNIVDQVLGLTGKLITSILSWPFLLFVLLVWLANRYRDHIGSILDRRGAVKRADFSSAVRTELEPVNKEIGDLKLVVDDLRSQLMKIETGRSGYTITSAIEPIDGRIKALETGIEKAQSEMKDLLSKDLSGRLKQVVEPLEKELERRREWLDRLDGRLTALEAGEDRQAVSETLDRLRGDVEVLKADFSSLGSREEEWAPRALVDELGSSLDRLNEKLPALNAAVEALQADRRVSDLQVGLDRLAGRLEEFDAEDSTDAVKSVPEGFHDDVEALRSDVIQLKAHVDHLAPRTVAETLEAGLAETKRDLAELRETVGGLRVPLERLSSQVVEEGSEKAGLPPEQKGGRPLPLEIMKQEMRSSRWEWRRVRRLAKSVGMTEEAAEAILDNDPEVTVSKDDWGRKIAKLSQR